MKVFPVIAAVGILIHGSVAECSDNLAGLEKMVFLIRHPHEGISDLEYSQLMVRAEVRLRKSGFLVKSGTPKEFREEEDGRLGYQRFAIKLDISPREKQRERIYSLEVNLLAVLLVPSTKGDFEVAARSARSKSHQANWESARFLQVIRYRTKGAIGIAGEWSVIEDAAIREVDDFVSDYFEANRAWKIKETSIRYSKVNISAAKKL